MSIWYRSKGIKRDKPVEKQTKNEKSTLLIEVKYKVVIILK